MTKNEVWEVINQEEIPKDRRCVRSVENDSDVFTKNVSQEFYEKHTKNFLVDSAEFGTG
jgi:hypothetical protein